MSRRSSAGSSPPRRRFGRRPTCRTGSGSRSPSPPTTGYSRHSSGAASARRCPMPMSTPWRAARPPRAAPPTTPISSWMPCGRPGSSSDRTGRPRLRLLVRAGRARARQRDAGDRVARLRPHTRRHRVGPRAPARDPLRAEPRVSAAPVWRRLVRLCLRDLDLEPLLRAGGARLAARDGANRQAEGRLLLTTHGFQTIAHTHAHGLRSAEQLTDVSRRPLRARLLVRARVRRAGRPRRGEPRLGNGFHLPEWLLARVTPEWRVGLFAPGRVEDNQDLYVLERT